MRVFDWFHEGVAPDPSGRHRFVESRHEGKPRNFQRSALIMPIAVGFCVALVVLGWWFLLAVLLYVASDDALATWLLTAILLAAGQVILAIACWRYAATVWSQPREPARHDDL
jgi:protein-S-isoprenylcysteine O-methyltransferase Ste14